MKSACRGSRFPPLVGVALSIPDSAAEFKGSIMNSAQALLRTVCALIICCSAWSPARAAVVHIDFTYHNQFGAVADGYADFDANQLANPTPTPSSAAAARVFMVISGDVDRPGSSNVNGTYTEADFPTFFWDTFGGTVDLTRELVGQQLTIPGGLSCAWGMGGCGDFAPLGAPNTRFGTMAHFVFVPIDRALNSDEWYVLGSAVPHVIPEPPMVALFGIGLAGVLAFRRRDHRVISIPAHS
jgi:PEP-CTERM motif